MFPQLLERHPTPELLREFLSQHFITPDGYERAMELTGAIPTARDWRRFVHRFLLGLGTAFLLAGVVFFVAAHWAEIDKVDRLGLAGASLGLCSLFAFRFGVDRPSGLAFLNGASVLVGVFLAVYGQTYQTGADLYQLFLLWSVLIIPWVLVSRDASLWFFLAVLLNVSAYHYFQTNAFFMFGYALVLTGESLFAVNFGMLAAWEAGRLGGVRWMDVRWLPRTLVGTAVFWLTWAPLAYIVSDDTAVQDLFAGAGVIAYIAGITAISLFYSTKGRDITPLAASAMSFIIVLTSWFIDASGKNFEGYIAASFFVVILAVVAAKLLHKLSMSWESRK